MDAFGSVFDSASRARASFWTKAFETVTCKRASSPVSGSSSGRSAQRGSATDGGAAGGGGVEFIG